MEARTCRALLLSGAVSPLFDEFVNALTDALACRRGTRRRLAARGRALVEVLATVVRLNCIAVATWRMLCPSI